MKKPSSELPQSEREAIIDLLHLCLYADAHISLSESGFINDVVNTIGWDQKLSFSSYESRSIAAARSARSDDITKKQFIEYAAERLQSKASKDLALSLCTDLMAADGIKDKEAGLLAQISALLK